MNYDEFIQNIVDTRGKWSIPDGEYWEGHHIVPKCLGGKGKSKSKHENIIWLYPEEHLRAHKLLCEKYPDNDKLDYALWCMSTLSVCGKCLTEDEYADIRIKHAEKLKDYQPWNTGKELPISVREKISKSLKGKKKYDGFGEKVSKAQKGKVFTEEHKKNISLHHADVSGKNNPMYGTVSPCRGTTFDWVNDGKRNYRWEKNKKLPIGYTKGFLYKNKGD